MANEIIESHEFSFFHLNNSTNAWEDKCNSNIDIREQGNIVLSYPWYYLFNSKLNVW